MSERERQRPERLLPGAGATESLGDARERAEHLLRAADDAIERALSEDSERFLQATRQSGGQ